MTTTIKARPTLYKGIQMRSRLEADYAAHMDRNGETWEYEPDCFAGPNGQWLPDFRVGTHRVLTELKPAYLMEHAVGDGDLDVITRVDAILTKMLVARESDRIAILELVFWSYGATGPDMTVIGIPGYPWQAFANGSPFPLLWPGMDQEVTLLRQLRENSGEPGDQAATLRAALTGFINGEGS